MITELNPANSQQMLNMKFSFYRRAVCNLFALLIISSVSSCGLIAQTLDSTHKSGSLVFSFGNGFSYAGKGDQSEAGWGLAIRTSLGYKYNGLLVSVGVAGSAGGTAKYEEWYLDQIDTDDLLFDKHDLFFDLAFKMGGMVRLNNRLYITAMSGVSIVMGKRLIVTSRTGFLSDETHIVERSSFDPCIGIPLEAGLNFNLVKTMGVGLCAFANINSEENYFGIALNLIFGK